jgi:hypothetical protein
MNPGAFEDPSICTETDPFVYYGEYSIVGVVLVQQI